MDYAIRTVYTREYILSLASFSSVSSDTRQALADPFFRTIRLRKRGRRGGVRERLRRRKHKPPVPRIVLINAQSMCNKLDELECYVRFISDFRDAQLICISETWLSGRHSDPDLPGFSIARLDRLKTKTGKKTGGGVCIYVNDRWCTNVTVQEEYCDSNIELMSVSLRPFYLPREFQRVFATVVYIPPEADTRVATDKIASVLHKQESKCPDSIRLVMGDFNKCRLSKVLPGYRQYVTCKTCGENTLDLCYGNVANAYRSQPLPALGRSIHSMVKLLPVYQTRLKASKPMKRSVKKWTHEALLELMGCFDCTEWDAMLTPGISLEEAVDVINGYIQFCVDSVIPSRDVKIFPNGKPWVTPDLARLLKEKRRRFKEDDLVGVKAMEKELRGKIRDNKDKYRQRVEDSLASGNSRKMWQGVNTMTGYKPKKKAIHTGDNQALAEELNVFYARFDKFDFREEQLAALEEVKQRPGVPVTVHASDVEGVFKRLNTRSAPGPDGISGAVLKTCREQLAPVFARLYQASLDAGEVPRQWKTATVVPVPKKANPKEHNDYRPVALTSIPFKCLERVILRLLLAETRVHQDPLQFAYQPNRSTEDAINTLLHATYRHLERPKSYVRMLFLDFSSAFNTMQPHLMTSKLMTKGVNPVLVRWVHSFLTNRPQRVKISGLMDTWSEMIITNTGAPQGCVLSPALFTLYTADCRCRDEGVVQLKFSDDTSITGLITDNEGPYRHAVSSMVSWCRENHLQLNIRKTKEIVVDFRRQPSPPLPLQIDGEKVEVVQQYKYLGTVLDCKLDWTANTTQLLKKGNQRLHFLKKLRSFKVQKSILQDFYRATMESVLSFNSLCFYGNMKEDDASRLRKLTKKASSVMGSTATDLQVLCEQRTVKRLRSILADPSHPLHTELIPHRSARDTGRMRCMRTRTCRFYDSFLPSAIRLFNSKR